MPLHRSFVVPAHAPTRLVALATALATALSPALACSPAPVEGSGGSSEDASSSDADSSAGTTAAPMTSAPSTTGQASGASTTGQATTGASLTGQGSQTTQTTVPEPTTTSDAMTTVTSAASTTSPDDPTTGGCEEQLWYLDGDKDDFGQADETLSACEQPDGYAAQPGDCDDDNAAVNPGQAELCDQLDNDCDELVDEHSEQNTMCQGCELDVLEGSQYAFCKTTVAWDVARADCQARGPDFDLMIVNDMPEQTFLGDHIIGTPGVWWLGANDLDVEGEWFWNNGDGVYDGYHNWQPGDPDNNMNSDCMIADNMDADWLDRPCADQYSWVCEGPA